MGLNHVRDRTPPPVVFALPLCSSRLRHSILDPVWSNWRRCCISHHADSTAEREVEMTGGATGVWVWASGWGRVGEGGAGLGWGGWAGL